MLSYEYKILHKSLKILCKLILDDYVNLYIKFKFNSMQLSCELPDDDTLDAIN